MTNTLKTRQLLADRCAVAAQRYAARPDTDTRRVFRQAMLAALRAGMPSATLTAIINNATGIKR